MQTKLKMHNNLEHSDASYSFVMKAVSYIAAFLGIGTFVGLVNVVVGILSGVWLAAQLYAHFKYEVPYRKARLEAMKKGVAICETVQKQE